MTDDSNEIIRKMFGEVSAMRADLTTLMNTVAANQKQSASDRSTLHRDMGSLRERLVAVEVRLSEIEKQWRGNAGDRRKLAGWLSAGGVGVTIAVGVVVAWLSGMIGGGGK